MALAYVFALIAGLGILLLQVVLGAKGEGEADGDAEELGGKDFSKDLSKDLSKDFSKDFSKGVEVDSFAALFLSTRFWVFASLGFGLSGTLLHFFDLAAPALTAALAGAMGLFSGLAAALSLRALRRSSTNTHAHVNEAVGQVGRVLVGCEPGSIGKVRIQLKGQAVDLVARSAGASLGRGEAILVEDVVDGVAQVSRRPAELE